MKTSEFLTALRSHSSLPLVFRSGHLTVSPDYHLTEVKGVAYETMDCGAMTHRWSETQFELWSPAREDIDSSRGHMIADKFVRIVNRVEAELPLNGDSVARIFTSFKGEPAALFEIDAVHARDGKLRVELVPDRTRCKASERQLAATGSACCGARLQASEPQEPEVACGCASAQPAAAAATCCV
jgi:hypothetical protein